MASTWGDSWSTAWGNSWGPVTGGGGGGGSTVAGDFQCSAFQLSAFQNKCPSQAPAAPDRGWPPSLDEWAKGRREKIDLRELQAIAAYDEEFITSILDRIINGLHTKH